MVRIRSRIISLLPAGTEIAAALGLMDNVVAVSHECDFPESAKTLPRITHCPIHSEGLSSQEVDTWVRQTLRDRGTIYSIDETLLRELRPSVILTQQLCDVCAVGHGTVARLAATLPVPPEVVNLEPSSVSDIFADIRRVGDACGVADRAAAVVSSLTERVEAVREHTKRIVNPIRCFVSEKQFATLWPATAGRRLRKMRYVVPWKKLFIEIDIYSGRNHGLIVAEVEFPNHASRRKFKPPGWFGREVTGEKRYSNVRLARE